MWALRALMSAWSMYVIIIRWKGRGLRRRPAADNRVHKYHQQRWLSEDNPKLPKKKKKNLSCLPGLLFDIKMPVAAKWIWLIMLVSVYYKLSLFNVHAMIWFFHIYMNVSKLCLNQSFINSVQLEWPVRNSNVERPVFDIYIYVRTLYCPLLYIYIYIWLGYWPGVHVQLLTYLLTG